MTTVELNGWTARRLDDLAKDVEDIRHTLAQMQADEVASLRLRIREAEQRRRTYLTAYLAPIIAGLIPSLLILLHHA